MRVLVTGGTGYLGRAIVRALRARGHLPVVFARRATAARLPGIAYDGDVRDRQALQLAASRATAVIHAAALVSIWRPNPREFDDVNVGGLVNVLDVARSRGIPRVVYTSSFLALPPAGAAQPLEANDYQRTKVRALEIARAALAGGVPLVITIPGIVYGPGPDTEGNLVGRLLHDHLHGRLPGLVGAEMPWSFAYVDDVAEAHVNALEGSSTLGEYVLGGENAPQIRMFEILRELTGRRLPRRLPSALASAAAAGYDLRARWLQRPPRLTRGAVEIFHCDWSLDSARSIAELNYRIRSLRDGVQQVITTEKSR